MPGVTERENSVSASRRRFAPEFKDELCGEVISPSESADDVALRFGLGPRADYGGGAGFGDI